jgi:hypothetical protein
VLAVTADGMVADQLLASGHVTDGWKVSDPSALESAVGRALAVSPLRVRVGHDGVRQTIAVALHRVPRREYPHYGATDGAVLLRGTIPRSDSGVVHLTTEYSWEMAKSDHFCYWVADRPLYLERITFDCRALTLDGRRPRYLRASFVSSFR